MTTDKVLEEILKNGLGPVYQEAIRERYQCDVAEGLFEPEEREYADGITALAQALSPEKMTQFAEHESVCASLREYAAKHGFLAGIYCGFQQFFMLEHETDGGFTKHVSDELYRMPKMLQHREYYTRVQRRNHLEEALEAKVGHETRYHLVSVECAWEQRAYRASIDGFYLGYHAAVEIIGEVEPNSLPGLQMEGNILCMARRFGFVRNRKEE